MVDQLTPRLFTMPPLIMGIIIAAYVIVVVISAGVGFGLCSFLFSFFFHVFFFFDVYFVYVFTVGSLADLSTTSLWQCNDSEATEFNNQTCSGVDIANYHTQAFVTSPNVSKLQKTLLISLIFVC